MSTPEQRKVTLRATFDIELTLTEDGFKEVENIERSHSYTLDGGKTLLDLTESERQEAIARYIVSDIGIVSMHGDYSGKNPMICLVDRSHVEKVSFEDPYVVMVDGEKTVELG